MTSIKPCLWFDNRIDDAIEFYTTTFKNAKVTNINRPAPDQPAVTAEFELEGQKFMALNGGPQFKFTEAVSFFVSCADQAEVDYFWNVMTANGGAEANAAGSRTSSASPGRSCPGNFLKPSWAPTPPAATAPCRPC